ncbi:hypothetical protein C8R45DRAFT_183566 [Mycena sanguinolenta]|nr:hypothetical protein C8R45DRAFT_183566 [Mycena sanguinolenta]
MLDPMNTRSFRSSSAHSQNPAIGGDTNASASRLDPELQRQSDNDPTSALASSAYDPHTPSSLNIHPRNTEADGGRDRLFPLLSPHRLISLICIAVSPVNQLGPVDDGLAALDATHGGNGTATSHGLRDPSDSILQNTGLGDLDSDTGFRSTAQFDGVADSEPNADAVAHSGIAADFGNAPDDGLRSGGGAPDAFIQIYSIPRLHSHLNPPSAPLAIHDNLRSGFRPPHSLYTPFPLSSGDVTSFSTAPRLVPPLNYNLDAPTQLSTYSFASIGSAEVGTVQGSHPRSPTDLDQAWGLVTSLPERDFAVLRQRMDRLSQGRAARRPVGFSLASTVLQSGRVGDGYGQRHDSDRHPSFNAAAVASTSAAALSPSSYCWPQHGPHQETFSVRLDTSVPTLAQDVGRFEPYSNFPQHRSATSPTSPMDAPPWGSSPDSSEPRRTRKAKPGHCVNCHVTQTSQWRREPGSDNQLCNACGQKARPKRHKPRSNKREHEPQDQDNVDDGK